jgi:hypothetical protein
MLATILGFFRSDQQVKCQSFGPERLTTQNLTELLICTEILAPYIASWIFSIKKVSQKLDFQQIRKVNPIKAEELAREICYYIPNKCSRYFKITSKTTVGACDLNPLSTNLITIRMKAQEYLEQINSGVPNGIDTNYLPDIAKSIAQSFPYIAVAYKLQGGKY